MFALMLAVNLLGIVGSRPAPVDLVEVQPCVWPNRCAQAPQPALASVPFQPCVWPNRCAVPQTCAWPNTCA